MSGRRGTGKDFSGKETKGASLMAAAIRKEEVNTRAAIAVVVAARRSQ
jgi:hypothetical protein